MYLYVCVCKHNIRFTTSLNRYTPFASSTNSACSKAQSLTKKRLTFQEGFVAPNRIQKSVESTMAQAVKRLPREHGFTGSATLSSGLLDGQLAALERTQKRGIIHSVFLSRTATTHSLRLWMKGEREREKRFVIIIIT